MELFSIDHVEATKVLLAARISGHAVTASDKAPHGDLLSVALGHLGWEYSVPVLATPSGHLFGTHAILRFLARSAPNAALYGGGSEHARASVDQWLDFVDNQARFNAAPLLYHALNVHSVDHKTIHVAQTLLKNSLQAADSALLHRTFLGGDRFTVADISLAVTLHALVSRKLFDVSTLHNLSRWYSTCTNQKDFAEVLKVKLPTIAVAAAGGKQDKGGKQEKGGKHEEGHGKGAKATHGSGDKKHEEGHAAHKKDEGHAAKHAKGGAAHHAHAAKWADEAAEAGEFAYAAGASFVAPLIAHYAAAARTANGGAASDWKDAHWPAASLLATHKRAANAGGVSLKVGGHTVTGDYEVARFLAHRYRSLNLYASAPVDSAQVDEFLELTLAAPSKEALERLNTHLTMRTFLADHNATIADFFVWAWLLAEPPKAETYIHLARWFAFFPQHVALTLGATTTAAAPAAAAPAAGGDKKKEDDFDLFGDEEDAEHEKILEQRRKEHEEKKKASGKVVVAKSSVILDVKPWDDTTDMQKMLESVKGIAMEGLTWGAHKIVPVAFGINKIQIVATIVDDLVSVDDLSEQITAFEDYVQSVDIASFNKL